MKKSLMLLAACVSFAGAVFAQAPARESQVPQYPGSTLVSEEQSPTKAELASGSAPDFAFALDRTWSTTAAADQVVQFYASRLGAAPGQERGGDPAELAPGKTSSVGSAVELWDAGAVEESPAEIRSAFRKRPRLSREDGWVRAAQFFWASRSTDGDPYSFTLTITDASIPDEENPRYSQSTIVVLSVRMFSQEKLDAYQARMLQGPAADKEAWLSAQKAQQAWGEAMKEASDRQDAEMKQAENPFAKAPTEKELGVPLYPGARYDVDQTTARSAFTSDGSRCYVFNVDGTVEALAAFYEQKTGNHRLDAPGLIYIPITFFPPAGQGDSPAVKDVILIGSTPDPRTLQLFIVRPGTGTGTPGGR